MTSRRRSVLIEVTLFLGLAIAIDLLWGSGNRFMDVAPHPFWAIVLLMAVQYGTTEALLATAACTVALLAGNMPAQGFEQSIHDYAIQLLFRPLLWMLASVVLGELRARHRLQQEETSDRLRDVGRQVELLTQAHTDVAASKERLETRLAGQLRTAAGVLEAARSLETLDPGKVLSGAADLLRAALNAKAFSLFLLKGDALDLVAAEGGDESRPLARRLEATSPLFQEIVGAQRYVSVASVDGERLLDGQGLMAGPLIEPSTGTLYGMLKIDEMRFVDFNLSSVQTFKALCEWIAAAYGTAHAHQVSQIQDEATSLYGMSFLDQQVEYLASVAKRFDFDLSLLSFQVQSADLPEDARRAIPGLLGDASRQVLRRTDLVFSHQPPGTQFAVLLPGATADGAVVVSRKLIAALREASGYDVPCTSQVRAICVAGDDRTGRAERAAVADSGQVA